MGEGGVARERVQLRAREFERNRTLQFATDQPTEMAAKPRCLSPVVRLHDDANPFAARGLA